MSASEETFYRANYLFIKQDHMRWRRLQSKQHILRSQVGFTDTTRSCPKVCQGCANFHGLSYGTNRETRTVLICAIHPYGWREEESCPDWNNAELYR